MSENREESKAGTLFQKIHPRLVWFVGALTAFVASAVGFGDSVQHMLREQYGPDVVLTVIPQTASEAYGKPDLISEFRFNDASRAARVRTEDDVRTLFSSHSLPIGRFLCDNIPPTGTDYYELNIAIENRGWQIAKDYSIVITFSGETKPDPGVRIALVESDGLDVSYLYQREQKMEIPACVMQSFSNDAKKEAREPQHQEIVSNLARHAYAKIGLTRDMVILKGNLEAQLFQTVNLLVKIPNDLKKFAVIYNVECGNCQRFYRTESFAQVVRPL